MAPHTRLTLALNTELLAVLDAYQAAHALSSRGEAGAAAIHALRDREMHAAYAELGMGSSGKGWSFTRQILWTG